VTTITSIDSTEIITKGIRLSGTLATQSLDDPRDDDFVRVTLSGELNHTSIPSAQDRFFGKSSSVLLVQQALDLKYKYKEQGEGGTQRTLGRRRPEFWTTRPVRGPQISYSHKFY
jgi:hypothetical protein